MKGGRRTTDTAPWVLKYWPVICALLGWALTGVVLFTHLQDDHKALEGRVQQMHDRMDFHFGKEW